jgi:flagellar assembly factor FliW
MSAAVMTTPPTASSVDATDLRTVRSHAFGEVAVPTTSIMHFASPIWGFPERHDYALLPAARQGLYWLQSVDDELTTFILADPFQLDATYAVDLSDTDREAIKATSSEQVIALVMLTLPTTSDAPVTANYRAPLVFNLNSGHGVQVVTSNDAHSLRTPVDLAIFPPQPDGVKLH